MDDPQPSPKASTDSGGGGATDAVQRLNGSGSGGKPYRALLVLSPSPRLKI